MMIGRKHMNEVKEGIVQLKLYMRQHQINPLRNPGCPSRPRFQSRAVQTKLVDIGPVSAALF